MTRNLSVVQAFRGMAACLVTAFHANHSIFGVAKYWIDQPLGKALEFGHAGVEFFFVLSGFIIYLVHGRDINQPSRIGAFAWKRARRIYPAYWVILLVVIPVFYFSETMGSGLERKPGIWFDSALLFHVFYRHGEVISVTWTLFHEIMFYMLFCVLIVSRRVGYFVFALWIAGSGIAYVWGSHMPELLRYYFDPIHLLFAMGIASAWLIERRHVNTPMFLAAFGLVSFAVTAILEVDYGSSPTMSMLYGFSSVCLLLGAVELERSGRLRVSYILTSLGDASYSIYLVHFIALSFLAKLAFHLVGPSPARPILHAALLLALVAAAIGAGVAYHHIVEAPILRRAGRRAPSAAALAAD